MLDVAMPADTIAFVSLEDCAPVMLEIPGKGFLFVEQLAKVGSSERAQTTARSASSTATSASTPRSRTPAERTIP